MQHLVRELDLYSWMTYFVVALNLVLWTVATMELAIITVTILKMPVSDVKVSQCDNVQLYIRCNDLTMHE